MQVYSALLVSVLFSAAFAFPKIEDISKNSTATTKTIDPVSSPSEDNSEATRKKKSATATVCVEIRPSGPYQRPFQICETPDSKPYAAPAPQQYYSGPTYEEVKPVAAHKPAPAYEAPAKTYSAAPKPTAAPAYASSKPYASHSPSSYGSVSYRSEDGATEMMDGAEEEEEHSDEAVEHLMRSAQEYGLPLTYLQPALKQKHKKGHNGVVITCQPSLAGYAATLPSYPSAPSYGGGYGGGYGSGYRASTMPRSYNNRYERPNIPKPQGYGGYAPAPAPYKVSGPVYKAPAPAYSSYRPAPAYSPPTYAPAPVYAPAPTYSAPAPVYKPAPSYSPEPQYKPVYAPAPAYGPPPPVYKPAPPQYGYSAPTYAHPSPAPSAYVPLPKPHAPVYNPPSTYRAADEDEAPGLVHGEIPTVTNQDKEKHTIETMTHIGEARGAAVKKHHEEGQIMKMGEPGWSNVDDKLKSAVVAAGDMGENENWTQRGGEEVPENVNENKV